MCITISTWLPLLKGPSPAVVFSFRNPLDVAMSLMKGDAKNFPLARGLRLWIVYNMRAIQNSHDLCRVLTSNEALLLNAKNELENIAAALIKCGLVSPNPVIDQAVVNDFVDPNLRLDPTKRVNVDKVLAKHDKHLVQSTCIYHSVCQRCLWSYNTFRCVTSSLSTFRCLTPEVHPRVSYILSSYFR